MTIWTKRTFWCRNLVSLNFAETSTILRNDNRTKGLYPMGQGGRRDKPFLQDCPWDQRFPHTWLRENIRARHSDNKDVSLVCITNIKLVHQMAFCPTILPDTKLKLPTQTHGTPVGQMNRYSWIGLSGRNFTFNTNPILNFDVARQNSEDVRSKGKSLCFVKVWTRWILTGSPGLDY